MSIKIRPFKIDVPTEEVDRMIRKIKDTRIPTTEIVPNAGEDYGASMSWIHRLYNKWTNDDVFRWSRIQTHLNRHNHFIASVPDENTILNIHFTHTRSSRRNAIPVIGVHGWPGSFHEFDRVVDSFVNPESEADPAFDVVVPSLPGFMWSSPPPRRGWTLQDTARVFNKLMTEGLGYKSYVTQAGDWGAFVARELGARYPGSCKAVHLNFTPTPLPENLTEADLTEREKKVQVRCQAWLDDHLGYAVLMRTRPQTIGVALADHPVGILLWVGEKYAELADPDYQKRNEDSWDEAILTTVSLYYFSGCIMTASLPYYENVKHAEFGKFVLADENRINVPYGFTSFMYDSRPGTRRGVERSGNLVFYNEIDNGGHFAALECPQVILADCRKFFGENWKS